AELRKAGGRFGRKLTLINGQVIELPNGQLKKLADHPLVDHIDFDRPTHGLMATVSTTVGATGARKAYGLDGAGVGVAVIDSGITSWHDDLTDVGAGTSVQTSGAQRVAGFVDFVNDQAAAYDDNGHGTHVAGIIAGNGFDSRGARAGIAPAAHLVGLKVLDARGRGVISDVIAAFDYAVANRTRYNIRVVNVSVGAAVTSSYNEDPLTLAAKRAVDAGIVVVAAAGNFGRNKAGQPQYGAITAPGNAPWVVTVGASSHEGTRNRHDDIVAPYSSRGPSAIDHAAKPDIMAPGTGIVSLSDPTSTFYQTKSAYLVAGTVDTAYLPYLSLTGSSMSAPAVAGTVALMIQANPNLTPNLAKAILQYTAQIYEGYNELTQGAGFLNAKGAVELSRYFATARNGERYPFAPDWSHTIHWGNHKLTQGAISPMGTAWKLGTVWGASSDEGDNIVWGTVCEQAACRDIVWGTASDEGDNIVWGTADEGAKIVWGTNIVWGTADEGDNIVWGTDCGGADCFNIVWGTADEGDNIVWGTADEGDNIVWGTSGVIDGTVWGTSDEGDNIVWGTSTAEAQLFVEDGSPPPDSEVFESPPSADRSESQYLEEGGR
ncbi:MAG TPA: S8 family peptidase, partial [Vicinamibacterales bacterium]|nr:S8 family peptidase [Vicinamibacterales bacterium]